MLAAMPPTPPTTPNRGEPLIRDRGDACPGALRLHPADDGRLARLRLPAGILTAHQTQVLARAAQTLGDGRISVTSRGNVELRGLGEGCGTELAELLSDAGLLPSAAHERIRNIVASPLAGADGIGCGDVQLWARELDGLLCGETWTTALSGRFLFALDDGRGDVGGLGADVTLFSAGPAAGSSADDVFVRVGRRTSRVARADAARAALAAADAFLAAARSAGTGAWRVKELPEGVEPDLADALRRAGVPARPADDVRAPGRAAAAPPHAPAGPVATRTGPVGTTRPAFAGPLPGVFGDPVTGAHAVSVSVHLGRLTAAQLRALAPEPAPAGGGDGELRLTPWRGAVVTGFGDRAAAETRLASLAEAGLLTRADSPWLGVGACTGRPGCAKSLADVRADATPGRGAGGLPVQFSGCERRCGHPHGTTGGTRPRTWVDVVATADGHYLVDGRPTPRTDLPDAVAAARGPSTPTR
ncbi:cobalamin biosynthesis protein CobG [Streptomyces sp. ms191]|uniref:cobalamin biosynthesis protein CobG n=1 Tax=Streptomyces sp. ms191 TaxID=1827978 RepID=UPI0011CE653D|nr:cobalamin biosynthesis protein CobG [Streptomyces sp. ms191]TXS21621.1 cobalamin biosynthesis protein CobG [Streptomyces sp. ms191]